MAGRYLSPTRRKRIKAISRLRGRGLSSSAIGKRLGLAPSTVRDYSNDPLRRKARARQAAGLRVTGVRMPAGRTPIRSVAGTWAMGGPHRGSSAEDAKIRGLQLRAIFGNYLRRG